MSEFPRSRACRIVVFGVALAGVVVACPVTAAQPRSAPAAFTVLAQANAANAAEPPPRTEEEKQRIKSAVILLSVLSGIALSGLLLIIAAVAIRGLQRKLAGPTRLDRDPVDLLYAAPQPPSGGAPPIDPAAQETRVT